MHILTIVHIYPVIFYTTIIEINFFLISKFDVSMITQIKT